MSTYQGFKIVYIVYEYGYRMYREGTIGEFETVEEALRNKTSNSRIEVELRNE